MPVSINNTVVSEITIDGEKVTEITIDNEKAFPSIFFEGFEQSIGNWDKNNTTVSVGSRSKFGDQSAYFQGGSSAEQVRNLPNIENGNTISFWFNINNRDNDDASFEVGGWGIRFEREIESTFYWIYPGGNLNIGGPDDSGKSLNNDEWYKLEYFLNGSSTKARVYDNNLDLVTEQTKSPSSISFEKNTLRFSQADGGWDVFIDNIEII